MAHDEKNTTFIFNSEIPYGQSINVVQFVFSKLFLFCGKFSKTVTSADSHKMVEIHSTSKSTRTLLLKSAE